MSKYNNLSKEELLQLVEKQEAELKTKKYGLVWDSEKEPEQVVLDCENNIPILQRVKEKEIKTDDSDDNILIEGDNYHALTCLNYTHKGKIDVIYIDPPYNTGSKDWKYNNDYVVEEDGYRHSKWLNMMEKRLEIAKNLLTENGILICAIDENELANVYLLLYRIFCSNSRKYGYRTIDIVSIVHNPSGIQGKNFSYCNEYALFVYPNKKQIIAPEERAKEDADIRSFMNGAKGKGNNYLRITGYNCFYPILIKNDEIIGFGDVCPEEFHPHSSNIVRKDGIVEIYPIDGDKLERKWLFARNSVEDIKSELNIKKNKKTGLYEVFRIKCNINYKTVWTDKKYNAKTYGTQLIGSIINKDFPFPKSLYNVQECILASTKYNKNAIILDFFAGSGTTGHAVLELNKQDGGNRKFILCTNNENKICEEVTYPRIHNVIKGYKFKGKDKTTLFEQKLSFSQLKNLDSIVEEMDKTIEENITKFDEIEKKLEDNTIKITGIKNIDGFKDGLNGNLQYFKTDLIPVERIDNINDQQRHELTEKAGQMIAIKGNTFEEIETNEWYQIFENKDKSRKTAIYFRENMDEFENLVKKIGKTKTVLYVFSYSRIDKKIFNYLGKNVVLEDIPEPILEIYKEINLTLKDK